MTDKKLVAYYEKLHLVISGELLNFDRIKEIWNINTGKYDYLIKSYQDVG